MARERLREDLQKRQRSRCIEELFCELVPNAIELARSAFRERPAFIFSCESFKFLRNNHLFEHPVYYSPSIYMQFEKLALIVLALTDSILTGTRTATEEKISEVAAESTGKALLWDSSIASLLAWISKVKDEQERERLKQEAATLVEFATLPPHPSSVLHTVMYKALTSMISRMVEVAEGIKMQRVVTKESLDQVCAAGEDTKGDAADRGKCRDGGASEEVKQDMGSAEAVVTGEGKQEEGDENMVGKVRFVMEEGMEVLWCGLEEATSKLVSVVGSKIERCMAENNPEAASWTALWLQRFMDHLSQ